MALLIAQTLAHAALGAQVNLRREQGDTLCVTARIYRNGAALAHARLPARRVSRGRSYSPTRRPPSVCSGRGRSRSPVRRAADSPEAETRYRGEPDPRDELPYIVLAAAALDNVEKGRLLTALVDSALHQDAGQQQERRHADVAFGVRGSSAAARLTRQWLKPSH